jgi:hypothetical protein
MTRAKGVDQRQLGCLGCSQLDLMSDRLQAAKQDLAAVFYHT